jgi:hypothetical protein
MWDQWQGFCLAQQVNSMRPLLTYNRYTCLQVYTMIEPAVCEIDSVKVMQTNSHPPIQINTVTFQSESVNYLESISRQLALDQCHSPLTWR